MSIKLHVLSSHIHEFTDNLNNYSKKQGKSSHRDVKSCEERCKGKYNESMMGNYIYDFPVHGSKLTYNWQSGNKTLF